MKHYPLSSQQLDFWFDQVLHPNVPLYNIGGYVRIAGPVNPTLFEQALNRVVAENDALRIYPPRGGGGSAYADLCRGDGRGIGFPGFFRAGEWS